MTESLRIACAQLAAPPEPGDAAARVRRVRADAAARGADLLVLGELFFGGGADPGRLPRADFVAACRAAVEELARETADGGPAILLGTPWVEEGRLVDGACLLAGGSMAGCRGRSAVPQEGDAVFATAAPTGPLRLGGLAIGVLVGAEIATDEAAELMEETGAQLLVALCRSRWYAGAPDRRLAAAVARVVETGMPLLLVDGAGAPGSHVLCGASFGLDADRRLAFQLPAFSEAVEVTRWEAGSEGWRCVDGPVARLPDGGREWLWAACVAGLRARAGPGGFVVDLDMRDAGLVEHLALDAAGPDRVTAVTAGGERVSAAGLPVKRLEPDAVAAALPVVEGTAAMRLARAAVLRGWAAQSGATLLSDDGLAGGFDPLGGLAAAEADELAAWRATARPPEAGRVEGFGPDHGDRGASGAGDDARHFDFRPPRMPGSLIS